MHLLLSLLTLLTLLLFLPLTHALSLPLAASPPPNPGLPTPWPPSSLPIHESPSEWYRRRTSIDGSSTLQCPLDWPSEAPNESGPDLPEHFFASIKHPMWWYLGHSHDYYLPWRDGHKSDNPIFSAEDMLRFKARNLNITQERMMFGGGDDLPREEMRIFLLPDDQDGEGCCSFGWNCWFHIQWWQDVRKKGGFRDETAKEKVARDKAYCCFYRYEKSCRAPRYTDSWLEDFQFTEPGLGRCVDREQWWEPPKPTGSDGRPVFADGPFRETEEEEERDAWTGAGSGER